MYHVVHLSVSRDGILKMYKCTNVRSFTLKAAIKCLVVAVYLEETGHIITDRVFQVFFY